MTEITDKAPHSFQYTTYPACLPVSKTKCINQIFAYWTIPWKIHSFSLLMRLWFVCKIESLMYPKYSCLEKSPQQNGFLTTGEGMALLYLYCLAKLLLFTLCVQYSKNITFSSVFNAGFGGWGWGILKPKISNIFSAALRLATFLFVPIPSAVCTPTFTWTEEEEREVKS